MQIPFRLLFIFLLFFGSNLYLTAQNECLIEQVQIIQPAMGKLSGPTDIWIKDEIIYKIGKEADWSLTDSILRIPAENLYIMPGLIDAHVHYFQSGGLYTRPDVIDLRAIRPYETERQWLLDQADDLFKRYLASGITFTCDVGGPMTNYQLKDQAAVSDTAPDLFVTGPLISTYQPEEFQIDDPPIIKTNSPEEARSLVQKQLPHKPDFIKIWYIVQRGETAAQHLPIIEATIAESHKHGIPVAVHATQLETARLAVKAGADILVHSVDDKLVDEAFIKLLFDQNVSYIPTLEVSDNYSEILLEHYEFRAEDFRLANPYVLGSLFDLRHLSAEQIPTWVQNLQKRNNYAEPEDREIMYQNLNILNDAGINVVAGTDAGNIGTMHGSSYYVELEAMEAAGLSKADVLKSATINGAKMLEKENVLGQVAEGYQADLVLLAANPLENLTNLQQIHTVLKSGKVLKPKDMIDQSPQAMAQRQLNAYNARNIDAFIACYHPDVKVYSFPDKLLYTGTETMRTQYAGMFENLTELHCKLSSRITIGNKVIDREEVYGIPGVEVLHAVAIYTVENGLITEVFFIQ